MPLKAWRFESSPAHQPPEHLNRGIMKNVTKRYIPGEEIIFDIKPSFVILLAQLLPIIVVAAGIIFIFNYVGMSGVWLVVGIVAAACVAALGVFLNWHSTSYRLTNKRVENRYGIIGSREEEISIDDIEAVDADVTVLGAIFNFGTVIIKAAGEKREVDFVNINSPKKVASKIEDMSISQRSVGRGNE